MSDTQKKTPMDQTAKARIMSTQAKQHGGITDKGSFAARAQSAADKNANKGKWMEENFQQTKNVKSELQILESS